MYSSSTLQAVSSHAGASCGLRVRVYQSARAREIRSALTRESGCRRASTHATSLSMYSVSTHNASSGRGKGEDKRDAHWISQASACSSSSAGESGRSSSNSAKSSPCGGAIIGAGKRKKEEGCRPASKDDRTDGQEALSAGAIPTGPRRRSGGACEEERKKKLG